MSTNLQIWHICQKSARQRYKKIAMIEAPEEEAALEASDYAVQTGKEAILILGDSFDSIQARYYPDGTRRNFNTFTFERYDRDLKQWVMTR